MKFITVKNKSYAYKDFIENILNKASVSFDLLNHDEVAIFFIYHGKAQDVQHHLAKHLFSIDLNLSLRIACIQGHLNIVDHLISLGANAQMFNDIAFREAISYNSLDIVKYLTEHENYTHTPFDYDFSLIIGSENGHLNIVKFLLDKGADINVGNGQAFISALRHFQYDIVEFFLEEGLNIQFMHSHENGNLIIDLLLKQKFSLIDLLLKHKVNLHFYEPFINERSVFFTLLMENENSSHSIDVINFLIKNGIVFNYDSCLLTCAKENNFTLFQYFFDLGGNILKSKVLTIDDPLVISYDFMNFIKRLHQSEQLNTELELNLSSKKQTQSQNKI